MTGPLPMAHVNVERLLAEYSEWRHEPKLDLPCGSSISARIMEMQENAGIPTGGPRYDILEVDGESFSTAPDGGMGQLCDRMGRAIARQNRMEELSRLIRQMPMHHRAIVEVGYHVPPRERPRTDRECARRLGINQTAYRVQKAKMIGWLEGVVSQFEISAV